MCQTAYCTDILVWLLFVSVCGSTTYYFHKQYHFKMGVAQERSWPTIPRTEISIPY